MIKALLAFAITAASGSGLLDVREPSRAVQVDDYKLINATSSEIYVDYYPEDTTITIDANTTAYISHETSGTLNVFTNTKFDGYCFLAPDSEDLVTISWTSVSGPYSWRVSIEDYGPATGIGFYNKTPLPTDVDFFIDTYKLGIYNLNSQEAMYEQGVSLIPDASIIRLYKEDGTYLTTDNLRMWRYKTSTNTIATVVWTRQNPNGPVSIIAQNFYLQSAKYYANYDNFKTHAEQNKNSVGPNLMYWANSMNVLWTNKITFVSGYYSVAPNEVGYSEPFYLTLTEQPLIQINNDGSTAEQTTFDVLATTFELVGMAMTTAVGFMGYMVFPGITIGLLILLPLIISLLIMILKMVKRG